MPLVSQLRCRLDAAGLQMAVDQTKLPLGVVHLAMCVRQHRSANSYVSAVAEMHDCEIPAAENSRPVPPASSAPAAFRASPGLATTGTSPPGAVALGSFRIWEPILDCATA